MRKTNWLLIAALLMGVAACNAKDSNPSIPTVETGDLATDVIAATNILVTAGSLPKPDTTASSVNYPQLLASRPASARFQVPQGLAINQFAPAIPTARMLAIAPNGVVIVAQPYMNQMSLLR